MLMCEIHPLCPCGPCCSSVLAMWLGDNCSFLLKKQEGCFWRKTQHMKDCKASNKDCMDLTSDLWMCVASKVFAVLFSIYN